MDPSFPTFSQKRLAGLVAVLSFGPTSLFAVLQLGVLVPATFVIGFFIILPLIVLLGEEFPMVEPTTKKDTQNTTGRTENTPLESLKQQYAEGKIDEAEFERQVQQILETENSHQSATEQSNGDTDDRLREIERELDK